MTRFEKEISGMLGEFWKKNAMEEVSKLMAKAETDIDIEEDGAIKWKSNGHYVPADVCEKLVYGGFDFDEEATAIKREQQDAEFIRAYKERMEDHKYTNEELGEMRNAFGEGTVVVDVFTGRKVRL